MIGPYQRQLLSSTREMIMAGNPRLPMVPVRAAIPQAQQRVMSPMPVYQPAGAAPRKSGIGMAGLILGVLGMDILEDLTEDLTEGFILDEDM